MFVVHRDDLKPQTLRRQASEDIFRATTQLLSTFLLISTICLLLNVWILKLNHSWIIFLHFWRFYKCWNESGHNSVNLSSVLIHIWIKNGTWNLHQLPLMNHNEMQGDDAKAKHLSKTPQAYLERKALSHASHPGLVYVCFSREEQNPETKLCVENTHVTDLSVTGKTQPMICMKRGIWAQTRQWITANVNCLSWTDRSFWRQPWATNCCIACCSKALWLLVSHSIHRITWVFWFYYLWLLEWNLQPTSTKQTPLSKVINKVLNQISFAMFLLVHCSLAQRKKRFLLTSGYGVFALIFITPYPVFVCVLLVQWDVPCTSRVSAVLSFFTLAWRNPFATHWLKSPQMTYALGFCFHYIALKMSPLKENVFTWTLELEEH